MEKYITPVQLLLPTPNVINLNHTTNLNDTILTN